MEVTAIIRPDRRLEEAVIALDHLGKVVKGDVVVQMELLMNLVVILVLPIRTTMMSIL